MARIPTLLLACLLMVPLASAGDVTDTDDGDTKCLILIGSICILPYECLVQVGSQCILSHTAATESCTALRFDC